MEPILEKVLRPEIIWVFIPLAALLFWGLTSVIHALRGVSVSAEEFEHVKAEVEDLRARVEELTVQQKNLTTGTRNA